MFTTCSWELLSFRVAVLVGDLISDHLLLFFAWPAGELDLPIATAIAAYVELS
jgi:hypothetical protein